MKELNKLVYFISFPISFIGFIFPIYATSLGASALEIGYLYSIFSIASVIIRPLVGRLIDKKGRKLGIIVGAILYTLVNFVFLLGSDFKHLLIGRTLQSIAGSFLWISVDTFISDITSEKNRGQNFGIMDQSITKRQMMGSFIGLTILFNSQGKDPFRLIFAIFFLTSLIGLYHGVKTVPETIHLKKKYEEGRIKDRKGLLRFLIIIGLISFISNLTAPIYLLYLKDNITNDLSLISFLFVPGAILATFLPRRFGELSDRYKREKIILLGLFLTSLLQIFIPFNNTYYSFMVLYTMVSLVGMFYGPAFSSIIIDFIGEEKRGRSYGLYRLATGIGASVGPILGAYIYKLENHIIFYIKGSFLMIMTVFLFYIYTYKMDAGKLKNSKMVR